MTDSKAVKNDSGSDGREAEHISGQLPSRAILKAAPAQRVEKVEDLMQDVLLGEDE